MKSEDLNKIAEALFLEENFWGSFEKKDAATQMHFTEKASKLVELLEKLGFIIEMGGQGERSTPPDRGGGTSGQK